MLLSRLHEDIAPNPSAVDPYQAARYLIELINGRAPYFQIKLDEAGEQLKQAYPEHQSTVMQCVMLARQASRNRRPGLNQNNHDANQLMGMLRTIDPALIKLRF